MHKHEIILKAIGLTRTESTIYLLGLGAATIGVHEIVKSTGINRATAYHALGTLMEKGLAAKKGTGNRLVFTMTKPENIPALIDEHIRKLNEQKSEIAAAIPLFTQHQKKNAGAVNVLHYEGLEGVKLAIEDALYCKSRHWDIISPVTNFFSEMNPTYRTYFMEARHTRGIVSRSLWEPKESQKHLSKKDLQERNPRILPEIMHGKFHTVICLYDEKVLIISSLGELYAIIIQSKEYHESMTAIYEGLWSISKELPGPK